jgi:hypothetical protein
VHGEVAAGESRKERKEEGGGCSELSCEKKKGCLCEGSELAIFIK